MTLGYCNDQNTIIYNACHDDPPCVKFVATYQIHCI